LKSLNPGKNKTVASNTSGDINTTSNTNIRNTDNRNPDISVTDIITPNIRDPNIINQNIIYNDMPSDDKKDNDDIDSNILAIIVPKRGRLLVFPHVCYHEGKKAISLPKLLLRGEMI
jgi:hypothetical protein